MIKYTKDLIYVQSSFKTAPNIGLIKYWGKWHETEIIPLNTNIGVTLNTNDLHTYTVIRLIRNATDQLNINGKEFPISDRIRRIFSIFRSNKELLLSNKVNIYKRDSDHINHDSIGEVIGSDFGINVRSTNSFPTGSGLASSSSGLSALALCLNDLLFPHGQKQNPEIFNVGYISRIGSGSACRCLYGNLVEFPGVSLENLGNIGKEKIVKLESERCLPYELKESAWMKECTRILIVADQNQGKKDVLSREGMQRTWESSSLIKSRVKEYVQQNIEQLKQGLRQRNFDAVMEVIMRDSNQFHATCMDSFPPLLYLNDFSREIISIVHAYNESSKYRVGYTFDAGSHAVLLMHKESYDEFKGILNYLYDINIGNDPIKIQPSNKLLLQKQKIKSKPGLVIETSIGDGPVAE